MDRESSSEMEIKYHKLATEYSKVRSHATVLKKALLDEQAKNVEMKELLRKHEQQLRKHDQEMDSLMFRNEQLSKRISVLQQELEVNNRKGRNKTNNIVLQQPDMTIINEELEKKIMENAQLLSSITDKDFEITDYKEKLDWLEKKLQLMQSKFNTVEKNHSEEVAKLKKENNMNGQIHISDVKPIDKLDSCKENSEEVKKHNWQEEAERWKAECEVLKSKPESNGQLTEYYETQISQILETKQLCLSETNTLWAENSALKQRLENLLTEHKELESRLESNKEELNITRENYKMQLDAMTEHLAAQNDKITKQSDEIEMLNHRLTTKK